MKLEDIKFLDKTKEEKTLKNYTSRAYLIVNTASKCGLSPQFNGLEKMYKNYKKSGLIILGFPCGQFKNQELSNAHKAEEFCKLNYGVTFPILDKINVNGENEAPIFTELKKQKGGFFSSDIKWNFTKFLIDENFQVVKRYSPITKPEKFEKDIKLLLK